MTFAAGFLRKDAKQKGQLVDQLWMFASIIVILVIVVAYSGYSRPKATADKDFRRNVKIYMLNDKFISSDSINFFIGKTNAYYFFSQRGEVEIIPATQVIKMTVGDSLREKPQQIAGL